MTGCGSMDWAWTQPPPRALRTQRPVGPDMRPPTSGQVSPSAVACMRPHGNARFPVAQRRCPWAPAANPVPAVKSGSGTVLSRAGWGVGAFPRGRACSRLPHGGCPSFLRSPVKSHSSTKPHFTDINKVKSLSGGRSAVAARLLSGPASLTGGVRLVTLNVPPSGVPALLCQQAVVSGEGHRGTVSAGFRLCSAIGPAQAEAVPSAPAAP